jgi:hypothetical protein
MSPLRKGATGPGIFFVIGRIEWLEEVPLVPPGTSLGSSRPRYLWQPRDDPGLYRWAVKSANSV